MNLKMVYQMCLTNNLPKPKLCYVKTIACEAVQVNEGNDKFARSPSCSPNKLLNYIIIMLSGERENNFSPAHVGRKFIYPLIFLYPLLNNSVFIFLLSRARVFFYSLVHF